MLLHQGSNLNFPDPESGVLPITPQDNKENQVPLELVNCSTRNSGWLIRGKKFVVLLRLELRLFWTKIRRVASYTIGQFSDGKGKYFNLVYNTTMLFGSNNRRLFSGWERQFKSLSLIFSLLIALLICNEINIPALVEILLLKKKVFGANSWSLTHTFF